MLGNVAHPQVGVPMGGAGAPMQSWLDLWNEWEIQTVVVASFSLQVILFFLAGIRRYSVSFVLKVLLWLVYLLADVVATYALGHMSLSLSSKSSGEHQLVAFWTPFLLLHLGSQDTITAYALEDNELWLRHLLNMFVQVAGTTYVLYKYINVGEATFGRAAMLVLAAGVVKYGERIWALKLASKKGSSHRRRLRKRLPRCLVNLFFDLVCAVVQRVDRTVCSFCRWMDERECFTKNKQFGTYALVVMTAHRLRQLLVKPLIIDRNEASIDWDDRIIDLVRSSCGREVDESKDEPAERKRQMSKVYKTIEVELALMYDMLYTKAEVIHTRYGYCVRAISLVSCFVALVVFTKSKRDGYSTSGIVITFALMGGACVLEVASVFKAIGSTWTCSSLRHSNWRWLTNPILFARYHLVVVKDGRWSDSVGQLNFISFCVHSRKSGLKGRIAHLIGILDFWNKVCCTKHAKLSPAVKEFVWGLLRNDKSHIVRVEDVAIRSGYWARKFSGIDQIKQLDWSMSSEFHESVLLWHIATHTFLNNPAVKSELVNKDKNMGEAVNTLSDYMMYLLVKHPDILPINPDARNLFDKASYCYSHVLRDSRRGYNADYYHQIILDYKEGPPESIGNQEYDRDLFHTRKDYNEYVSQGKAVLVKARSLTHEMLDMKLELTHKMAIIGTVWMEMLCYAATNATGDFHARQLSNGGEFLTHILLLSKYAALNNIEADETSEASAAGHVQLTVYDDCKDEITEIS